VVEFGRCPTLVGEIVRFMEEMVYWGGGHRVFKKKKCDLGRKGIEI